MALSTFNDFSTTAASNIDVNGISIQGTTAVQNIDNAFREFLAIFRRDLDNGMVLTSKSGNYTAVANDNNAVIRFSAAATLTLTAAATLGAGWHCWVMADGGAVVIDGAGSETINGSTTITIPDGLSTLLICDGTNFRALEDYAAINGKADLPAVGSITADYTVTTNDRGDCINADATSGAIFVNLPAAATAGNGFTIVVKKTDSSTNNVTVDAAGGQTIDGSLLYTLRFQHQSVALICNGSAWFVMADGEIVDEGSNANGEYIRFASGRMICTKTVSPGVATNVATGSGFMSNGFNAGSMPFNFASAPRITVTGSGGGNNGWTLTAVRGTATSWGTYRHASFNSDATTTGFVDLIAVGNWF